jgi:hypothetical protein
MNLAGPAVAMSLVLACSGCGDGAGPPDTGPGGAAVSTTGDGGGGATGGANSGAGGGGGLAAPFVYPRGCYTGVIAAEGSIPQSILGNDGLVGLAVVADWSDVETSEGVFDWTQVDAAIAQAKGANKKIVIDLVASAYAAPAWLEGDPAVEKVSFVDPNPNHGTAGQMISVVVLWDPIFVARKIELIKAAGAKYAGDPDVVATMAAFANYYTDDWDIPLEMKTASYSYDGMVEIGERILDAEAAAFPNQAIKLSLSQNDPAMDPGKATTQMATDVVSYAVGPSYGGRFFVQKNLINTASPIATSPDLDMPDPSSNDFLFKMLRDMAPNMGLQMVASAAGGSKDGCRLNAHVSPCPEVDTLDKAIDISLTYAPTYLEFWPKDAEDPALRASFENATGVMKTQALMRRRR